MAEKIIRRRRKRKRKKTGRACYWTKGRCRKEAKKFKTRTDFNKYASWAYRVAKKNGWLEEYHWLEITNHKWNDESVMEVAKKYTNRKAFRHGDRGAFNYAQRNGLLDKMTWFVPWNKETEQFQYDIKKKVVNLLLTAGVAKTKEWLFIESGKSDVYTEDQCKILKRWSESVNDRWGAWKKHCWYAFPDVWYKNGYDPFDEGFNIKP